MAADGPSAQSETFLTNGQGKRLFCRNWCEDLKSPRALVIINHGAGEHCLWYTQLANLLKENGCYVFAHDHVGHGQSEGDRVHVNDFHEYVDDVFQHFDNVVQKFPDVPRFMIGHSMGGSISIIAAMERPEYFSGVVLIAPAVIADPHTISPLKIRLGKVVAKIWPQAPILKLNPDFISRDKTVVQRYKDDPLVHHGSLKARWGASFLAWLQWIEKNFDKMTCPTLTLHGTEDRLTVDKGSHMLHDGIASQDKTLKIYEGFYHQLHNEPGEDGAGVRQEIINWITARM